jgi:hypothetical protein
VNKLKSILQATVPFPPASVEYGINIIEISPKDF